MNKIKYRFLIWKQLLPEFRGAELWYAGDIGAELAVRVIDMLFPVCYGILLERVILEKDMHRLGWVLFSYLALQTGKSLALLFQKHCQNKVNFSVYRKLRVRALENYFCMKFSSYQRLNSGDVKMTLEDAVGQLTGFQTRFYRYCLDGMFGVVMAVILFVVHPQLAIVAILTIPVTFLLDHLVSRGEKGVNEILNENDATWATWLDETVKCWKEIRVNRCEAKRQREFEEFQKTDETYFRVWLRFWVTRVLVIPKIKDDFMMQFLLYFLGGICIYYHQLTIGVLLVFVKYYGMLSEVMKAVSKADAELQAGQPHYERIIKHLTDKSVWETEGILAPERKGICFERVSFGYEDKEQKVIRDMSFCIREGERIGFAGESGAGKSTLVKLLLGLLEPDEGSVRYGGVSLMEMKKAKLYETLAYIGQDAKLFQESIAENLRMGKSDASTEDMEEACKRACIYEFIQSLPEGFETEIGENGAMLSGGQRQRILLARAFLREADLYVFDEATSALDGQAEEELIEAVKVISKDKTVIIVAHKEKLLAICDRVIRLA